MSSLAELFADLLAPGNSPEIRPHSPSVRPGENGANAGVSPNSPNSPGETSPTHSPGPVIDAGLPRPEAEARAFEEWLVRHALGEVRLIQQPAVTLAELRRRYPGIIEAWPEGDAP